MVAQVDFYTMLSGLGGTIDAKRKEALARSAANEGVSPDGQVDYQKAIMGQLRVGNVQGATALANVARANAQDDWTRKYQSGMLDVARQNAGNREKPAQLQIVEAAGLDPKSPEGRKALFPRTDTPISAGDKKVITQAEDELPNLEGTLDALKTAKGLNDKTFSGYTAGARASIGSNLPDWMVPDFIAEKKTADSTTEWQKIMAPEALKTMADTLKGATTDFELRTFIQQLGDPTTPPAIRGRVIDRMIALTEKKRQLSERRIKDLRGGSYYKPGAETPAAAAGDPLAAARAAIGRGADRNAVIQRLRDNGIDPSGL
ncbi:MAG: hypothetical protein IJ935_07465 [Afipia sp.]|nr:hypothetical protein [Afipia sp.]